MESTTSPCRKRSRKCPDRCWIFGKQLKIGARRGEIHALFVQVAVNKTGKIWQIPPINLQ